MALMQGGCSVAEEAENPPDTVGLLPPANLFKVFPHWIMNTPCMLNSPCSWHAVLDRMAADCHTTILLLCCATFSRLLSNTRCSPRNTGNLCGAMIGLS
jgi:hypothetical protein